MGKPQGWGAFDKLARKIVSVPKQTVDDKIAQEKAIRKVRRKK